MSIPMRRVVHFVGIRTDQLPSAVKVWGVPDFVHSFHDKRMYGDIDLENDTVVLGNKGRDLPNPKYSWQDHELH